MSRAGTTPPFRGLDGCVIPHSVAEIAFLHLGGIDQWVMIRGENTTNPVLVLVHGGPGFPEMQLFRHFNGELEKSFTCVYWEQRGTDKSFDPRIPIESMNVEQFLSDLDELVDAMRKRFDKEKVAIYGHSWGSLLGVLYAARHPEKVSVYVGTGQIGDWPASEKLCYEFTLAEAERRQNSKALRELRGLGPTPHNVQKMMRQRTWFTRWVGILRGTPLWKALRVMLGGPESSVFEFLNMMRGVRFSTNAMWDEVSRLNLLKLAPVLQIPVFFFIGRHDRVVDPQASMAYFEMLTAPQKRWVWFEGSAHEPAAEEPNKFHALMASEVRPCAVVTLSRASA
jgi:pimeloyl-ACP methyl ester carboxylesterase